MSGTFESLVYDELAERGDRGRVPAADRLGALDRDGRQPGRHRRLRRRCSPSGGYRARRMDVASRSRACRRCSLPRCRRRASARRRRARGTSPRTWSRRRSVSPSRYVAMLRAGLPRRATIGRRPPRRADRGRADRPDGVRRVLPAHRPRARRVVRRSRSWSVSPWSVRSIGTALAGRTARMAPRVMGAVVLVGASADLGRRARQAGRAPLASFTAIAFGYGLLNNAMIVAEARLQQVINGPARATVTSVHGFATESSRSRSTPFVLLAGSCPCPSSSRCSAYPTVLIAVGVAW